MAKALAGAKRSEKRRGRILTGVILAGQGIARWMTRLGSLMLKKGSRLSHEDSRTCAQAEDVDGILASLAGTSVVVRDIDARYGTINRLVIGKNGAVFLIESQSHAGRITQEKGELRRDGEPLEQDFIRQTTTNAFWLRDILEEGLGISPRINAAIVFPNALISVPKAIYGVDVIKPCHLKTWMGKARGNLEVANLIADAPAN